MVEDSIAGYKENVRYFSIPPSKMLNYASFSYNLNNYQQDVFTADTDSPIAKLLVFSQLFHNSDTFL